MSDGIILAGDIHGGAQGDAEKINNSNIKKFCENNNIAYPPKYIAYLGDSGVGWNSSDESKHFTKWMHEKSSMHVIIPGNHDNYDFINALPEVDMFGNKVYMLEDNIVFLQRGKVYTIDDKKILALSGALSIDKKWRQAYNETHKFKVWWPQEYWSKAEQYEFFDFLKSNNDMLEVDYVLSHTCPSSVIDRMLVTYDCLAGNDKVYDEVAILFEEIRRKLKFKSWHFGHFHFDRSLPFYDDLGNSYYEYHNVLGLIK